MIITLSGAIAECPMCSTKYDLHGVDAEDFLPPIGDGCDYCMEDWDLDNIEWELDDDV